MILVTVGTDAHPFDRLVAAAERVAALLDEPVVVQRGTSRLPAPHCAVHDVLPPSRLAALLEEARVVVTHAGPASVFDALEAGHRPLVVPRRLAWGEHVDDHQVDFARRLADRVVLVEDPAGLLGAIHSHLDAQHSTSAAEEGDAVSERFASRLDGLIREILGTP